MCVKGATRMRRVGDRGWRWAVGGTYRLFEQKIAKYQNTPPDLNNFGKSGIRGCVLVLPAIFSLIKIAFLILVLPAKLPP